MYGNLILVLDKPFLIRLSFSSTLHPMKTNRNASSLNTVGGHARQGDTLLRRSASPISSSAKPTKTPTIALGETTGHHHSFRGGGTVGFADEENTPLADFVQVTDPEGATLTHEEHEAITFPAGDYESLKQVEDTEEEVRRVQD